MVWRTFWIVASVVGTLLAVLIWAANTQVTFLFHHPRTAGVRVEIDKRTGGAVVVTPVSAKGDSPKSTARPCLEAAETVGAASLCPQEGRNSC